MKLPNLPKYLTQSHLLEPRISLPKVINNSLKCSPKFRNIKSNTSLAKTSQNLKFQFSMISETSKDMISPMLWEIKVTVVLATLKHSTKPLNLDLRSNMVKRFQFFQPNMSWAATTWPKVAKVDGHISTVSSPNKLTWYQINAHHIRVKPRESSASSSKSANQRQKSSRPDTSEVAGEKSPKSKSWKKSSWTAQSLLNSKPTNCSSLTATASSPKKVWFSSLMNSKLPVKRNYKRVSNL